MKTLKNIQTLAKVGKIFSKVVFILCIVGGAGCILGIISLALIPEGLVVGGVTIHALIEQSADVTVNTCYAAMATGIVLCVGEALLSKIAYNYFKNELIAGDPFTLKGAKELFRLGIYAMVIPVAVSIVASIVHAVMRAVLKDVADLDLNNYVSLGFGIMLLIVSLICRYGAEIKGETDENRVE